MTEPDPARTPTAAPDGPSDPWEASSPGARHAAERLQFSLAELLLLSTGAALYLSLTTCLLRFVAVEQRAQAFTGLTGLVSLTLLIVLGISPTHHRLLRLTWWIMLLLYVAACMFLLVRG